MEDSFCRSTCNLHKKSVSWKILASVGVALLLIHQGQSADGESEGKVNLKSGRKIGGMSFSRWKGISSWGGMSFAKWGKKPRRKVSKAPERLDEETAERRDLGKAERPDRENAERTDQEKAERPEQEKAERPEQETEEPEFLPLKKLKITKGTLLVTSHKRLMLALDKNTLVRLPWRHSFWQSFTWLNLVNLPLPKDDLTRAYVKNPPEGYDPDRAVTLATLLLGKKLPYAYLTCNEFHWIAYICYGVDHSNPINTKCPLNRPLVGVRVVGDFYLKDGTGVRTYVSDLEPYDPDPEEAVDDDRSWSSLDQENHAAVDVHQTSKTTLTKRFKSLSGSVNKLPPASDQPNASNKKAVARRFSSKKN